MCFSSSQQNQGWPQDLAEMVIDMELTPLPFLFCYLGLLIVLGMFLDGIALILLTVPVVFPVANALDIDPIHLGIVVTMGVELSVITPPVGFNLLCRKWYRENTYPDCSSRSDDLFYIRSGCYSNHHPIS